MAGLHSYEICRRTVRRQFRSRTRKKKKSAPSGSSWFDRLDGDLTYPHLIPDFIRSKGSAKSYDRLIFRLPKDLSLGIRSYANGDGIRSFCVLAAAVALVLHRNAGRDRLSGEDRLCLAAPALATALHQVSASREVAFIVPITGHATLRNLLTQLSQAVSDAYRHHATPSRPRKETAGHGQHRRSFPLIDNFICLAEIHGPKTEPSIDTNTALLFRSRGNYFEGELRYRADLFAVRSIRQLLVHLKRALRLILFDSDTQLSDVSLLTPCERRAILETSQGDARPYPVQKTVHALFEEKAKRHPDRIAVKDKTGHLTYRDLNKRANRVANLLIELGTRPREFVAILQERGTIDLVFKLAALKAGTAFVPIDLSYPPDRVSYMLKNSEARFLLTQRDAVVRYRDAINDCSQLQSVVLSDKASAKAAAVAALVPSVHDGNRIALSSAVDPAIQTSGEDLCYMIYTSGSTGQPKGAMIRHDGTINHIYAELDLLEFTPDSIMMQSAPASSDISVWQYLAPVLIGGRVLVVDKTALFDATTLFRTIKDERVSIAELVPAVLRNLVDYAGHIAPSERALPHLRWMMVTGEAAPVDLVNHWLSLYPSIKVVNAYGPSEASDDVTQMVLAHPLSEGCRSVPIGRPLPNCRVYIVDQRMQLVPRGTPGEICVAGICVGNGYWRDEDKTAEAFLSDPFTTSGARGLYRTGDQGRWLPDETIEFLGRIDQQVNIRGFRIELEEIETVLRKHPAVGDAVACIWNDPGGAERLVAYVVVKSEKRPTGGELRSFMKKTLPDHMVPAIFAKLDRLPLAPSGKVDRRALPAPHETNILDLQSDSARPTTPAEETLANIWAEILRVKKIGIDDNFFERGGDSILGIKVANRARSAGLQLEPSLIFSHPTIRQLAQTAGTGDAPELSLESDTDFATRGSQSVDLKDNRRSAEPFFDWAAGVLTQDSMDALERRYRCIEDVYPLGPAQKGIYTQCLLAGSSGAYIEQTSMDLRGDIDQGTLLRAWQGVIRKHPALRTGFARKRLPQPVQVVASEVDLALHSYDWRHVEPQCQAEKWRQFLKDDRCKTFSIDQPPLHRLTLLRLSDDCHRLLLTYHHLLMDGWSEPVVLRDLLLFYRDISSGRFADPPVDRTYRKYIAWLSQQDQGGADDFWRRKLKGFDSPTRLSVESESPTDAPKRFSWLTARLTTETTQALHNFARRNHLTLNTVLQAGWALTLGHYGQSIDVVYGIVVSGRQAPITNIESMVGLAVNTLPVRVQIDLGEFSSVFLRRLQCELFEIQTYDYSVLSWIQSLSDVRREKQPLVHSLFSLANYPDTTMFGDGVEDPRVENVQLITVPDFPLTCFAVPDGRFMLRLVYDERQFDKGNITDVLLLYVEVLEGIAATHKGTVGAIVETVSHMRHPARSTQCLEHMAFEESG